jgi:hypothetical protein
MAKRKGKIPPPSLLAMVIADFIWKDPGTGKRTILGCFSVIHAHQFPAVHPVMGVYCAVNGARGKVTFRLCMVDVDEEVDPLFEVQSEGVFDDPRAVGEIDFHGGNIIFPHAGEYRVQLHANGQLLGERRVVVVSIPGEQNEQN